MTLEELARHSSPGTRRQPQAGEGGRPLVSSLCVLICRRVGAPCDVCDRQESSSQAPASAVPPEACLRVSSAGVFRSGVTFRLGQGTSAHGMLSSQLSPSTRHFCPIPGARKLADHVDLHVLSEQEQSGPLARAARLPGGQVTNGSPDPGQSRAGRPLPP